jgi:histone deacetylase 11
MKDGQVNIFDMYNSEIYPKADLAARNRIDCNIPLPFGCGGAQYLGLLRQRLPAFLDSDATSTRPRLAIYNAGTDPFIGDRLGGLQLSAADILERDLFVIHECRVRAIPIVMLLSGGYSPESYRLVAATVRSLLQQFKC